jgi:hypothetical protein
MEGVLRGRVRSLDEGCVEEEKRVLSVLELRFHLDFLRLRERVAVKGV